MMSNRRRILFNDLFESNGDFCVVFIRLIWWYSVSFNDDLFKSLLFKGICLFNTIVRLARKIFFGSE